MSNLSASSIAKNQLFPTHYLNDTSADVIFFCGKSEDENQERVPAHKVILAGNSDVFEAIFYGMLHEGEIIPLPDVTPDGFRAFLRYFYFDDDSFINMENITEILYLSDKYNIEGCLEACCEFLEVQSSPENVITAYVLAIRYELVNVKRAIAFKIFRLRKQIFTRENMQCITRGLLELLIQIYWLKRLPKKTFELCMLWAEEDSKQNRWEWTMLNIRRNLEPFFQHIDFSAMKLDGIQECVAKYGNLFSPEELQQFVLMATSRSRFINGEPINLDALHSCRIFKAAPEECFFYLDPSEDFWFRSKIDLFLGGIQFSAIYHQKNQMSGSVIAKLSLIKASSDGDTNNGICLFSQQIDLGDQYISLGEAMSIEANAEYVIQIQIQGENNNKLVCSNWVSALTEQ